MRESIWRKTLKYFQLTEEEPVEQAYEDLDDEDSFEDFDQVPTVRKITRYPDLERVRKTASLHSISPPPQVKVHIVEPKSFNDCQQIADRFKSNVPVIINLQLSDGDLSKRLIDFSSGLTYGLDGGMQKIADRVFLLTPSNVEVSAEERRRLQEKGFFNQL
ncbi:MAG: cell division protein SepF [Actinobacteria bacterium]|nr:cell division protein SepF [Actinomycetota bacterium]